MNRSENELISIGFRRSRMAEIRGDRTRHLVTLNRNSVKPGEELYVDIPKLKDSSCLVLGSLHLVYDMTVTGTKSHVMNNVSKRLQQRLQIKLAGETAYDCSGESLFSIYKDVWLTKSARSDNVEYGIANSNLRGLITGDDSALSSGNSDALLYSIYSKKQKMYLDYIIRGHALYSPFLMSNNFRYIIIY